MDERLTRRGFLQGLAAVVAGGVVAANPVLRAAYAQETRTDLPVEETTEPSPDTIDCGSNRIILDQELRREYGLPSPEEAAGARCRPRRDIQCTLDPEEGYLLCAQEKVDGWYLCNTSDCEEEVLLERIADQNIIDELEDDQLRMDELQSQVGFVPNVQGCYERAR